MKPRILVFALALAFAGCAHGVDGTSPGDGPDPDPGPGPGPDPDPDPDPDPTPDPRTRAWPIPDWTLGDPAAHGLDPLKLEEAAVAAEANDSYCLLVVRGGELVFERYFGDATPADTHDSWSIAKSYSSTLVGIAIDNGDIGSLEDRVSQYVPEWDGTDRANITIRNLVSMTSGLDWSVYQDYVEMATFADDHTAFALELGMQTTPGSEWVYHNGGVQVLEAVFRGATGMTVEAYAREHLWSRIGMTGTRWAHDGVGQPTTYANVLATCRDHARFGYLYLNRGNWAGTQIVSESWVTQALTPSQDYNRAYGFLFWLNGQTPALDALNNPKDDMIAPFAPPDLFAARGFGNQFIDVIPSLDLVIVRFGPDPRSSFDFGSFNDDAEFGVHDQIVMPILAGIRE